MKSRLPTLDELKKTACAPLNQNVFDEVEKPKKKSPLPNQPCKQVMWTWGQLVAWSLENGIEVVKEHRFHPERKWRFDFFIKALNCGIEYEGIFSEKSRHTSKMGFSGDVEKYREAAAMGITVFRYTAKDYKNVLKDINKLLGKQLQDGI